MLLKYLYLPKYKILKIFETGILLEVLFPCFEIDESMDINEMPRQMSYRMFAQVMAQRPRKGTPGFYVATTAVCPAVARVLAPKYNKKKEKFFISGLDFCAAWG